MNIKKLREKLGLTKYALSKKIDVSWNTVHYWEKGFWKPSQENKKKLEDLINETKILQ